MLECLFVFVHMLNFHQAREFTPMRIIIPIEPATLLTKCLMLNSYCTAYCVVAHPYTVYGKLQTYSKYVHST